METSRNPESGDHQGGLKEKNGGWERRIKASSRLGKEQTLQRGGEISLTLSPPGTWGSLSSWRITISDVWQLQKYFQGSSFINPDNN